MSKDIGVIITLPPKIKTWADKEAAKCGLPTAAWLRMQVFEMHAGRRMPKRRAATQQFEEPEELNEEPEASIGEENIDALVAQRLAEADEAGLTAPRVDPDAQPPLDTTNVRPLRRPPPPYSTTPGHMRGLV